MPTKIPFGQRVKAFFRKERVVKGAVRGRVFEKKENSPSGGAIVNVPAEPTMELTGIRIIRKDGTTEVIK